MKLFETGAAIVIFAMIGFLFGACAGATYELYGGDIFRRVLRFLLKLFLAFTMPLWALPRAAWEIACDIVDKKKGGAS